MRFSDNDFSGREDFKNHGRPDDDLYYSNDEYRRGYDEASREERELEDIRREEYRLQEEEYYKRQMKIDFDKQMEDYYFQQQLVEE